MTAGKRDLRQRTSRNEPKGQTPSAELDECFVIMPFGGWFDSYYVDVYKPAIESTGLKPRRADDLYRPSSIVNDIWLCTQNAKLVMADLTGKNPNVFYELGLAHALAKPVILITATMDDVPFDLRSLRVLAYDKNQPNWGKKLAESIRKSIEEVLRAPLSAVLPTFLNVDPNAKTVKVSEQEKTNLELRQDLDLLLSEFRRLKYSSATDAGQFIQWSGHVTVSFVPFSGNSNDVWRLDLEDFQHFQDFMDEIWRRANEKIEPYRYGIDWELRDKATGEVVKDVKGDTGIDRLNRGEDHRSLDTLGIRPGCVFEVVPLASAKQRP